MTEATVPLTAELVTDSARPQYAAISPDGSWVAYTVAAFGTRGHPPTALWLAPCDGSSAPVRLAADLERQQIVRWLPDSASLTFWSDGQLHRIAVPGAAGGRQTSGVSGRAANDASGRAANGARDGTAEPLIGWRGAFADDLPLAGGQLAAFVAADEPDAEDARRAAEGDDAFVWGERPALSRLRVLDLVRRELTIVDGLSGRHVIEVAQRPDGGPLAVLSWACPDDEPGAYTARLHLADVQTGQVLDVGPTSLDSRSLAWWRAGERWHLAYLAVTPPGLVGGSAIFDVTVPQAGASPVTAPPTGAASEVTSRVAVEHRNLTAGMTVCPVDLVQVADGRPLALFAAGLDTELRRLDPGTLRFERLWTIQGSVENLTASTSGDMIAALVSQAYESVEVHAGPVAGPLVRLSDTRPQLRGVTWGTQERLSYLAADGLPLDGILILPAASSRDDGPFPMVTLVHGGPYDRYADDFHLGWWPSGQWLATAGYAVFLPNPRGGQGHGQEFAVSVAGAVGTDEWTDIMTGIDLLIADGVADPDRLGIGGWSHGGFIAAWAVGQTRRFKAALMGAGISDWGLQAGVGELGLQEAGLGGSCGWEGTGPHRHQQLSPISYASQVRTPVLIVHGEQDTNVPVGQAVYFHRALCQFGVEHEFVMYPREGHPILERAHQIDLLNRTRGWFDRWLAAPPAS